MEKSIREPVKEPIVSIGDIIGLILTSLVAIVIFFINISSKDQSKQVEDILSAIQFFLSIAIGWFIQRLISIAEFRKYMHQFALGAYRRINDIDNSITRLRNHLVQMRHGYPKENVHELDVIAAIADEISDNIKSSISDWEFFIGDDLKAIERRKEIIKDIDQLYETSVFSENPDNPAFEERLVKLENELSTLNSTVPSFPQAESYPREGRFSSFVWDHFSSEMDRNSCIYLKILILEKIPTTELNKLLDNQEIYFSIEQNMFTIRLELYSKYQGIIGEVENPFVSSEVYGNDYFYTLMEVLSNVKVNLKADQRTAFEIFTFFHASFVDLQPNETNFIYLKIPVTKEIIAKG